MQRVLKPRGKLFPGPRLGSQGDWRRQLFLDSWGNLYERHRTIVYEKPVERWFAVTSFEATPVEHVRVNSGAGPREEQPQSRSERAAARKRETETMLRHSLSVVFGDLVDELEFAITEGLFDDDGQRVLRRLVKRVVNARILSYEIGEPRRAPPKPAEHRPPIIEPATRVIH